MDARGLDVSFCCWFPASTADKRTSANDMFNIVNEHVVPDTAAALNSGYTALHTAAIFSGAAEIDILASCGYDFESTDDFGRVALHSAARRGNAATYFALLNHGAKIVSVPLRCESLLRATVIGRARKSEDYRMQHTPAYEAIAKKTFCTDPWIYPAISTWRWARPSIQRTSEIAESPYSSLLQHTARNWSSDF